MSRDTAKITNQELGLIFSGLDAKTKQPIVQIDYARYETFLEGSGLSEAQKQEFLGALWQIVVGFVDMGFGVHPIQQACGQREFKGDFRQVSGKSEIDPNECSKKEALING